MMKVNFLAREHQKESLRQDAVVGICDPEGEQCAYTTTEHGHDKWCATIKNCHHKKFLFIAIDKNIIILRADGNKESTCDGMVYIPQTRELSFVELKAYHNGKYISSAEDQLFSTLKYFLANHNYKDFYNRRAFACNPHRPAFAVSARERINKFYKQTHFRLMPQATIEL